MHNETQRTLTPFSPSVGWKLALGVTLLCGTATSAFAETFQLDSIDFSNANNQTRIVLHAGSIVPVQKVMVSDTKLILDIDQVDSTNTIRTNFAGASNISHVIMQPINDHKIRMIIRGDHLTSPTLAFYDRSNSQGDDNGTLSNIGNTESAVIGAATPVQPTGLPLATETSPSSGAMPATKIASVSEAAPAPLADANVSAAPISDAAAPAPLNDDAIFSGLKKMNTDANASAAPMQSSPLIEQGKQWKNSANDIMGQTLSSPLAMYIPFGLAFLLILGVGLFIFNRYNALKNASSELAEEAPEPEALNSKQSSFRELADAYRNKTDARKVESALSGKTALRKNTDDVIGLSGLHALDEVSVDEEIGNGAVRHLPPAPATQRTEAAMSLEQMLGAMQKMQAAHQPAATPKASIAPKNVASQYAQNQSVKPSGKAATAAPAPQQEQARARQIQEQLELAAARTAAAKSKIVGQDKAKTVTPFEFKSANATQPANAAGKKPVVKNAQTVTKAAMNKKADQGPLPGNPEVLNFLRNVAELMEKDGKPDIAQNIHRNLSPQA